MIRNIFIFFSATIFACSCSNKKADVLPATLRDATDIIIGTALTPGQIAESGQYLTIVNEQFSGVTPENEMKMYVIWPGGPGTARKYGPADVVAGYARDNGKALHGHVLAWYEFDYSSWVGAFAGSPSEFEDIYHDYITEIVSRYPEAVSWDVLNEGVTDPLYNISGGLNATGLLEVLAGNYQYKERDYMTRQMLGENYLYKLFTWAHEANPDADLFYNDYNLILFPGKLDKVLELCDNARAMGAPIDGIGFQSYFYFPADMTYGDVYRAFKKVADRGYKVRMSEFSILINGPFGTCTEPPSFETRLAGADIPQTGMLSNFAGSLPPDDQLCGDLLEHMAGVQAQRYYDYVRAYFDAVPPHLRQGITVWGISDCCHWFSYAAPWLLGNMDWPALYDVDYKPKPGYYSFLEALQEG